MPLETGQFISDLDPLNPPSGDPENEGDNHIRLIKNVLRNTFPNLTGVVNANQSDLNSLVGQGTGGLGGPAHIVSLVDPTPADGADGDFFFVRVP